MLLAEVQMQSLTLFSVPAPYPALVHSRLPVLNECPNISHECTSLPNEHKVVHVLLYR